MHRIKSLYECKNKNYQVNYQDLIYFDDINSIVPEELNIPLIRLRPKSIYHPFDYNKDTKQIFGEI